MTGLALKYDTDELGGVLDTLIELSNKDTFDPFKDLVWPESIDESKYWMSPELMSIHNTDFERNLSEEQKIKLSKWEFINFCSLNVTGIRELLIEMTNRLHSPGFELLSEYLHILVGEENEHMWYFAKFCNKYAGKIYPDRAVSSNDISEDDLMNIMIFVRILVFEEIVDYYNKKMGKDDNLPEFVQRINWLHHLDEGRHIKYGRMYIEAFYKQLKEEYSYERLRQLENTIKSFMQITVQKLYRREMYIDAGLSDAGKIRKALIKDPARVEPDRSLVAGTAKFFKKIGMFESADVWQFAEAA